VTALAQVLAVAIGTFLIRVSMVAALGRITLGERTTRTLGLIAPAVLAALVAQTLLLDAQEIRSFDQWHVAAAAATGLALWKRSIGWTLGGGMVVLWALLLLERL
jgi:branched-subunit amino acid transport protein